MSQRREARLTASPMWSSPSTNNTWPLAMPARNLRGDPLMSITPSISMTTSTVRSGSVPTSIAPSPSHLAIRTPFLAASWRTADLKS